MKIKIKIKKIASRFALCVFGLVLAILLLEGLMRLFGLGVTSEQFVQHHDLYGAAGIPNRKGWHIGSEFKSYIELNSRGVRDREFPYEKDDSTFRILVLGDSVAAAFEVALEDSFCKVLEARLNERRTCGSLVGGGRQKFEVINVGVRGMGTDSELLFFRHEGYKYQPDLVILAFIPSNDIVDNSYELHKTYYGVVGKPYFLLNEDSELELHNFPAANPYGNRNTRRSIRNFLFRHSRLYVLLRNALVKSSTLVRIMERVGFAGGARQVKEDGIPLGYFVYSSEYTAVWNEAIAVTDALILQLNKEVEERGAKLVVAILTNCQQVHDDIWQETLATYPAMKDREWDVTKPDKAVAKFMDEHSISYLWMVPGFRDYASSTQKQLHFHYDGHWTVEGHRLAAQHIYDYLVEQKLIM